jgi:hypothetical protein
MIQLSQRLGLEQTNFINALNACIARKAELEKELEQLNNSIKEYEAVIQYNKVVRNMIAEQIKQQESEEEAKDVMCEK